MIAITEERLQWFMQISSREEIEDVGGHEIRELARFALASLNSRLPDGAHDLYAVPPLSIPPEQVPETLRDEIIDLCDGYEVGDIGAQEIWDVCRATMLSGVKP